MSVGAGARQRTPRHVSRSSKLVTVIVVAASVAAVAYRWPRFIETEPRADQAAVARLVNDLTRAERFVPEGRPGAAFAARLEADTASFLGRIVRSCVITPVLTLNAVPLAILYVAALVAGTAYCTFVGASILASASTVLLLRVGRAPSGEGIQAPGPALIPATSIVLASASYLHLFSPLGVHNFGIAALVAAAGLTQNALSAVQQSKRPQIVLVALAHIIALLSHWTNVLLLVPATIVAIAMIRQLSPSRRFTVIATYGALVLACAAPALVFMWAGRSVPSIKMEAYSGVSADVHAWDAVIGALGRAVGWVRAATYYFTTPGLVVGVVGVVSLAIRSKMVFPMLLLGTHWALWTAIPGFSWNGSPSELRTFGYALPSLSLGVGWALALPFTTVRGSRCTRGVALGAVALAVAHLCIEWSNAARLNARAETVPRFASEYLDGQGTLRAMVRNIDARLAPGSVLMTWNYDLQNRYSVLSDSKRSGVLPALDSAEDHLRAGDVESWVRRRRVAVPCNGLYVLAPAGVERAVVSTVLRVLMTRQERACEGDVGLGETARYSTRADLTGDVVLYRVEGMRMHERIWSNGE